MTDTLPVRHNINSFPDTPVHRVFRWLADGVAVDLTGWTGRLRVGLNGQFLKEVSDAVTTGIEGTVTLHVPAGELPDVGNYWYALDLFDPSNNLTRLVTGSIRVSAVFQ